MKAKVTSKGQITIPYKIRQRLHIVEGQVLEFDDSVPFLKATKAVNEKEMRESLGVLRKELKKSISSVLKDARGEVELP